ECEPSTEAKAFWKDIPGQALYVPREKILTLNLRYPTVGTAEDAALSATKELQDSGIELKVEIASDERK
ncbi:MAG TPA: hypothetical protein VHY56_08730, partial [Candidatus Binataceae bacterium]|nr:hypothetical protein [Candidatus Binataceae bacterium]